MALVCFCATACQGKKKYPDAPPYKEHPTGEFPIVASYAFYDPYMTDEQFEWVKEAGFNTIMKAQSYDDARRLSEMAAKHGIAMFVSIPAIRDTLQTARVVDLYKDNPVVWGFNVIDEPNASQFPWLAQIQDSIVKYAPGQNSFFNLLPEVSSKQLGAKSYKKYVEDFTTTVNPPFLSLDIYPVRQAKNGSIYVADALYSTMEVISKVARESGRPLWAYILSNKHWSYPAPREEYIRFQAFSALAYGAQGLIYYTYLMPDFDREAGEYSLAPIDWDGLRTPTWYMVRNVNRELQQLAPVFLGAEVVSVTHTGTRVPEGTKRTNRLPAPFRGIESFGEGTTVSHLRNGDREYLLVVNRDVNKRQLVRLTRTAPVTRLYGDGTEIENPDQEFVLDKGGYALFRF